MERDIALKYDKPAIRDSIKKHIASLSEDPDLEVRITVTDILQRFWGKNDSRFIFEINLLYIVLYLMALSYMQKCYKVSEYQLHKITCLYALLN